MTDSDAVSDAEADGEPSLRERVETWLSREMPIIQMHGGTSAVREVNSETGEVIIELGGGCKGCSVSDVTTGNIEAELIKWPEIDEVTVRVPDAREQLGGPDQAESIMGVDRTEGGRGDWGSSNPGKDHL
ncbi:MULTISPECIES: NifU family protein [Haloterrigena]|uniref:NifU family protein n=2 Tax=Haloterrigena TaxID=121871 RepID=A0A8J8GNI2_9EURY|nr:MULTISPECIES: NifU family protein [Haloterrigena]NUB93334.1 NifU family protein [Haloterrigena gelatinilytica]QRV13879.1 NifU family protein [Haloterrigena salifodinae]